MVAFEHDKIVAEYYDEGFHSSRKFDLWSGTKAWTSLLFGVMEQEGLIHIHDTLGDIFRMHPFGTPLVMPIIERTLRSNTFFKCVQDSQCQMVRSRMICYLFVAEDLLEKIFKTVSPIMCSIQA